MSSWFVPTEFEERDGKPVAVKLSFGPGMEISSEVTAWDPPSLFASTDDWDDQLESAKSGLAAEAWETLTVSLGLNGVSVGQRCSAPTGVPEFSGEVEYLMQWHRDLQRGTHHRRFPW